MVERGETRLDAEARVAYAAAPGSVDDGLENEIGSASMNRRIILVIGSLILLWSPIALGQQQTTSPPKSCNHYADNYRSVCSHGATSSGGTCYQACNQKFSDYVASGTWFHSITADKHKGLLEQ